MPPCPGYGTRKSSNVSSYAAYAALQTGSVTTSWPTGAASPHTPPQAQLHGQCLIGFSALSSLSFLPNFLCRSPSKTAL
jgi:hypothetical protein